MTLLGVEHREKPLGWVRIGGATKGAAGVDL